MILGEFIVYPRIKELIGGVVMKQIRTGRILIIPCSISLAKSLVLYVDDLKMVSPVSIPDYFPSDRMKGMLPLLIELLEAGYKADWWICFIIDLQHQQFIGELEIEGDLLKEESLSFSLKFIDGQTEEEFATEVMEGLLSYFQKLESIQLVRTEVVNDQTRYKNLLKRFGFEKEGVDGQYWLMRKYIR